jgi:hypothetical protein
MSQTSTLAEIEGFHARTRVPVGKDAHVPFSATQTEFPRSEDCLIYIPLDKNGRKITWDGSLAKSAADYVYFAMSEAGVSAVHLRDDRVFQPNAGARRQFMILSNNLLACAKADGAAVYAFEARGAAVKFPSGASMPLPVLLRAVQRKMPETGASAIYAFGRLNLIHYSAGKGVAYDSMIPLILANPSASIFQQKIETVADEITSLYEIFSAGSKSPEPVSARMVEVTVVRRMSMQHTLEVTYLFDWAEFFKIEAFYHYNRRYAVRFAGEPIRVLDQEAGEALSQLVRSPKYVIYFKEFDAMAVADRVVRQEGFDYMDYLQRFMADPAMQPFVKAGIRGIT